MAVELPSPTFVSAHAVLGFRDMLSRSPAETETLTAALRPTFPNMLGRPLLPPESPAQTPHLVLASTSSQLAISAVQADFEVRFYGDYAKDLETSLQYLENKVLAIVNGVKTVNMVTSMIGLIGKFQFSFGDEQGSATDHILATHLNVTVDQAEVQDALARVAVRIRDTYFVTMTLNNYETRVFERPVLMGQFQHIRVRPWEGEATDRGLELTLDINNSLEGRTLGADPVVTDDGVRAVTRLLREIAQSSGRTFAESGSIDVQSLAAISVS